MRVGSGFDLHRLVVGRRLVLGGVELLWDMGLQGHSDADVICHAVIDALYETYGVEHVDMPCTPARVWAAMQGRPEPPQ